MSTLKAIQAVVEHGYEIKFSRKNFKRCLRITIIDLDRNLKYEREMLEPDEHEENVSYVIKKALDELARYGTARDLK